MHVSRSHRLVRVAIAAPSLVATARSGRDKATAAEMQIARAAVAKLPAADRALLARHHLHVELVGRASLEAGMLGATSIVRGAGERWAPTRIRVASHIHGRGPESLAEVVQHELGHAISVLRDQDRTEDAAQAYARRW